MGHSQQGGRSGSLATGWLLAGVLTIPLVSVSAAVRLADLAAPAGRADTAVSAGAFLSGVILGLLVYRLIRAANSRFQVVVRAVVAGGRSVQGPVGHPTGSRGAVGPGVLVPAMAFVAAGTSRRGPPSLVA